MPTMTDPEEPRRPQPWHPVRATADHEGRIFPHDLPAWLWATRQPPMSPENQQMIDRFKRHLRTLH